MSDHRTLSTLRLAAGVLLALAAGERASAQPARPPSPAAPATPDGEARANQELNLARQLAKSGQKDPDAIVAATEALKHHVKPAAGTPDDLAIQALSILVDLHHRAGNLAEEVNDLRELLDALARSFQQGNWRLNWIHTRLAEAERRLAMKPERRRRLAEASELDKRVIELINANRLDEALQTVAEATEVYREVEGDEHSDVANVLVLRGNIHRMRREYTAAGSLYDQALLMRKRLLGEAHPDTRFILEKMAGLAEDRGDFAQATRLFERAVELGQQDAAGAARADLLETIGRLRTLYGDHAGARPFLEQAAAIREQLAFATSGSDQIFGNRDQQMGLSPGPHLGGLTFPGNPLIGGSLHRLGPGHGGRLGGPFGLGGAFDGFRGGPGLGPGKPTGLLNALSGRRRTPRDRPSLFGGDLGMAEPFAGSRQNDDNLAIATNPSHPWTLRLRAMRMYLHAGGRLDPRPSYTIRSAFENGAIRGDVWVAYARNSGRLADVAQAQGEAEKAQLLRLRSVAIGLEATDPSEATRGEYAEFLDGFITLILGLGESGLARDLAVQSVVERRYAWGDRHPAYAAGLDRLADLVWARGDRAQAMLLYEKAREIRRAAFGGGHIELAGSSYRLALLHEQGGDRTEARRHAGESLALSEAFVMAGLPFLPERQRLALLAQSTRALSLFLDVTGDGPDAREAYRHLVAWKGVATEAVAAQRVAAATPELRALNEELSRARDDLNPLFYASVPRDQAQAHARRVRAQTRLRDDLESRLAAAVKWHPIPPTPDQVAAALPRWAVLVDFARYQHHVPASGREDTPHAPTSSSTHFRLVPGEGQGMRFEARYAAFVICPGESLPVRVELGPAAPIDEAVMTWLDRIEHGGDLDGPARRLARDLWAPLAPHVGDARHVLIAPDGLLNFLPWGALPGRTPGSYLLADHGFGVVGAARFLVQGRRRADAPPSRDLLVVGGVDYALAEATPAPPRRPAEVALRSAPVAGKGLVLKALPGTQAEAEAIRDLFRNDAPGGGDVVLLSGPRATKERVRTSLGGKRNLHLATHGYFASPEFASALIPEDTGAPLRSLDGMDRSEVRGLYPGLLSGLVFAGANRPDRDPVTGVVDLGSAIMTAEEIAGLDLSACDLAVLSACDTGRGSIAGGEGVLGLQRAFHQAGTRTVVASLWKVEDRETQRLMEMFYSNLWRKRLGPLEALRQAQLEFLGGRSGRGEVRGFGPPEREARQEVAARRHPRFWASWVTSGVFGDPLTISADPAAPPFAGPVHRPWSLHPVAWVGMLAMISLSWPVYRVLTRRSRQRV